MFFLWTGVMAGILFSYLVMRYANRKDVRQHKGFLDGFNALWASPRWRLAGAVASLLIIPVPFEFVMTGFLGSFGPLEAFKTILFPWIAGVGFGIWIYPTIAQGVRNADRGGGDARREQDGGGREGAPNAEQGGGVAPKEQGDGGQHADPEKKAAEAEIRRELSFIPIAVAMLAVAFMISDQQYGWFARLQKLTIAGSGLEFAPRSAGGQQEAVRGPGPEGSGVVGEDRVSVLVDFMANFEGLIERDLEYLRELGDRTPDLAQDRTFAELVVVPLGTHLQIFHNAHRYNNLGLLADRNYIDAVRSFARYQSGATPEERLRLAENMRKEIHALWEKLCAREKDLSDLKLVSPDTVRACFLTAKSTDVWLASPAGVKAGFNYAHPYGTLLAAMLLNAADEADSAVKDLDEWVAGNAIDENNPAKDPVKSWLVFRTLNQAMALLLAGDSLGSNSHLALEHSKKLAQIGQSLLESDGRRDPVGQTTPSWKAQNAKFVPATPVDLMWELGLCPSGLTPSFKRAMSATLQASNNVAFILSENIDYAETRPGLIREMEQRADHLAKDVNMRCLVVEAAAEVPDHQEKNRIVYRDVKRLQAVFFDTAAAVQLALAARQTKPQEKRVRLCNAFNYANRAKALQAGTIGDPGTSFIANLGRVDFLDGWATHRMELTEHKRLVAYGRLVKDASSQLAQIGYSPDTDC